MEKIETAWYRPTRATGALYCAAGVAQAAAFARALNPRATRGGDLAATATATYLTVAGRALLHAARGIGDALGHDDLATARALLPSLVGRDPTGLDAKEITRATIESVAENTVDAIVAPALYAAVGGAPGAFVYRAVNTLDAMVGHRSARYERFGWASARFDDALNLVPARVTAALVMLVRPASAGAVLSTVSRDGQAHPSPNAGVAEAAFAGALGVRLGGTNRYGDRVEVRPSLGDGPPPEPSDIARACTLSRDVTIALAAALAASGLGRRLLVPTRGA
jgi:adenosylcobinamide-phosphate synthase